MVRWLILGFGVVFAGYGAMVSLLAPAPEASAPPQSTAGPKTNASHAVAPLAPKAEALRKALTALAAGATDEERNEHAALLSFYEARGFAALWLTEEGALTPKAALMIAEIRRAGEWGLEPKDFALPSQRLYTAVAKDPAASGAKAAAAVEIAISRAVLKYGRYAGGGGSSTPPRN